MRFSLFVLISFLLLSVYAPDASAQDLSETSPAWVLELGEGVAGNERTFPEIQATSAIVTWGDLFTALGRRNVNYVRRNVISRSGAEEFEMFLPGIESGPTDNVQIVKSTIEEIGAGEGTVYAFNMKAATRNVFRRPNLPSTTYTLPLFKNAGTVETYAIDAESGAIIRKNDSASLVGVTEVDVGLNGTTMVYVREIEGKTVPAFHQPGAGGETVLPELITIPGATASAATYLDQNRIIWFLEYPLGDETVIATMQFDDRNQSVVETGREVLAVSSTPVTTGSTGSGKTASTSLAAKKPQREKIVVVGEELVFSSRELSLTGERELLRKSSIDGTVAVTTVPILDMAGSPAGGVVVYTTTSEVQIFRTSLDGRSIRPLLATTIVAQQKTGAPRIGVKDDSGEEMTESKSPFYSGDGEEIIFVGKTVRGRNLYSVPKDGGIAKRFTNKMEEGVGANPEDVFGTGKATFPPPE